MSQTIHKFGAADLTKFIEIYRKHECLWDTQHINYKNRDAREAALSDFSQELGVEGYGPKEITTKIKNLRTQYNGERRKVEESRSQTGSGVLDVYKPKLCWYELMDSFLKKPYTHRDTTSNLIEVPQESSDILYVVEEIENTDLENTEIQLESTPIPKKKSKKSHHSSIDLALNKLENIEQRARADITNDAFDIFGKYVASTLRMLNSRNCIHAQDKIQATLSKYRLKDLEFAPNTPMPNREDSEENWWNVQ